MLERLNFSYIRIEIGFLTQETERTKSQKLKIKLTAMI